MMFSGIGLYASISSSMVCAYFRADRDADGVDKTTYGLWGFPENNGNVPTSQCLEYPEGTIDYVFWFGRVMAVLAPIFVVAGIFMACWAKTGLILQQNRRIVMAIVNMCFGTVCQGLTLVVLEAGVCQSVSWSDENAVECTLLYGANASIASTAFLAAATLCMMSLERKEWTVVVTGTHHVNGSLEHSRKSKHTSSTSGGGGTKSKSSRNSGTLQVCDPYEMATSPELGPVDEEEDGQPMGHSRVYPQEPDGRLAQPKASRSKHRPKHYNHHQHQQQPEGQDVDDDESLSIKHGTGRTKLVDFWGRLV